MAGTRSWELNASPRIGTDFSGDQAPPKGGRATAWLAAGPAQGGAPPGGGRAPGGAARGAGRGAGRVERPAGGVGAVGAPLAPAPAARAERHGRGSRRRRDTRRLVGSGVRRGRVLRRLDRRGGAEVPGRGRSG